MTVTIPQAIMDIGHHKHKKESFKKGRQATAGLSGIVRLAGVHF